MPLNVNERDLDRINPDIDRMSDVKTAASSFNADIWVHIPLLGHCFHQDKTLVVQTLDGTRTLPSRYVCNKLP